MPKIKYVGLKTGPLGETAFSHDTNITWFPGTVKDVPQAIAGACSHPDVFALADAEADEDDGDRSTPPRSRAGGRRCSSRARDDGDDGEELTEQQKRMAAFAAGDTGNENDLALGAGDQVVAAAGTGVAKPPPPRP
jgi:hypothetical protein